MKSPLKDKSYIFAVEIVRLIQDIQIQKREFVISKQLLRSGTSIGALIREGEFAQSNLDFINKFSISLKEANETKYWLELLKDTDYIDNDRYIYYDDLVNELISMLVVSIKTMKQKLNK
ncbi:MAG: four helix bundle protein [Bacteroidetes bacterium]|nr:four helix bundle protein [Bacteroidota bacterium]